MNRLELDSNEILKGLEYDFTYSYMVTQELVLRHILYTSLTSLEELLKINELVLKLWDGRYLLKRLIPKLVLQQSTSLHLFF